MSVVRKPVPPRVCSPKAKPALQAKYAKSEMKAMPIQPDKFREVSAQPLPIHPPTFNEKHLATKTAKTEDDFQPSKIKLPGYPSKVADPVPSSKRSLPKSAVSSQERTMDGTPEQKSKKEAILTPSEYESAKSLSKLTQNMLDQSPQLNCPVHQKSKFTSAMQHLNNPANYKFLPPEYTRTIQVAGKHSVKSESISNLLHMAS